MSVYFSMKTVDKINITSGARRKVKVLDLRLLLTLNILDKLPFPFLNAVSFQIISPYTTNGPYLLFSSFIFVCFVDAYSIFGGRCPIEPDQN